MNEQEEDTQKRVGNLSSYSNTDIQKAWNLLSMHNSELLLENYELRERLDKVWSMSVLRFIGWKIKGWINTRNIYE
jgi:regulator of replication initiation timing